MSQQQLLVNGEQVAPDSSCPVQRNPFMTELTWRSKLWVIWPLILCLFPFINDFFNFYLQSDSSVMASCLIATITDEALLFDILGTGFNSTIPVGFVLPLSQCVSCNNQSANVKAVFHPIIFGVVSVGVIALLLVVLILLFGRLTRASELLNYGIAINHGNRKKPWFLFWATVAIYIIYGVSISQLQVSTVDNVRIDCPGIGAILQPIPFKNNGYDLTSQSSWIDLLKHSIPFLLLAHGILYYMYQRTNDVFRDIPLKKLIKKPKLIQTMRETLKYGVDEVDVDKACESVVLKTQADVENFFVRHLFWSPMVHSFNVERNIMEAVVYHLSVNGALTPLSWNSDVDADGDRFEIDMY